MKKIIIEAGPGKRKKHPKSLRKLYPDSPIANDSDYIRRIQNYKLGILTDPTFFKNIKSKKSDVKKNGKILTTHVISHLDSFLEPEIYHRYNFARVDLLLEQLFDGSKVISKKDNSMINFTILPPKKLENVDLIYLDVPLVGYRHDLDRWDILADTNRSVLNVCLNQNVFSKSVIRYSLVIPIDPKDARNPQKTDFIRDIQFSGIYDNFYAHILKAQINIETGDIKYSYLDSYFTHKGLEAGFKKYMRDTK